MSLSALTVEQRFQLSLAARRVQSAVDAITLTNNPSQVLFDRADAEIATLQALLNAASPLTALVANGATLNLQNSAGTAQGTVTATVAAGAVSNVKLPATATRIVSGTKITAPVTGTGTTGVTPTIANGVVTALVLS